MSFVNKFAQITFHEVNYPEKTSLEKVADVLLKPARYLFRGKQVNVLDAKIVNERIAFSEKTWMKTALMVLLLLPSLLVGIPLKALCYLRSPYYLRKLEIPSPLKREFERFFSPQIFKSYRQQLQNCIRAEMAKKPSLISRLEKSKEPFLSHMHTLLKITDEKIVETPSSNRAWHERWLKQLRLAIQAKESLSSEKSSLTLEMLPVLDRICFWMYTEVKLVDAYQQMLVADGKVQFPAISLPLASLSSTLEQAWKQLKGNSGFNKYIKENREVQDPHLQGNLPTLQFQIGKTSFIYTSRITQENNKTGQIHIAPEFLHYLDVLETMQKRHLYINLMNRATKGSERALSMKIEELELKKRALTVVTLDNNSDFFKQGKPYDKLDDAVKFKEAFFQHLFAKEGSYHWPCHLQEADWQKKM